MYNFRTHRGGKSGYRKLNPIEGKKNRTKSKRKSKQEAQNKRREVSTNVSIITINSCLHLMIKTQTT